MHLVCMIASVIKDARRLRFFKTLLESICQQAVPPLVIFISIHIAPHLSVDWDSLLMKRSFACPLRVLRQKREKLQFVQYKEMMDRLERVFPTPAGKDAFIMFSDDDDLWHPL